MGGQNGPLSTSDALLLPVIARLELVLNVHAALRAGISGLGGQVLVSEKLPAFAPVALMPEIVKPPVASVGRLTVIASLCVATCWSPKPRPAVERLAARITPAPDSMTV